MPSSNTFALICLVQIYFIATISTVQAGFGSGPGTDPFGFGNVTETCKEPFVTNNFNPAWTAPFPTINYLMMSKELLTRLTQHIFHSITVDNPNMDTACMSVTHLDPNDPTLETVKGYGTRSYNRPVFALAGNPGWARLNQLPWIEDFGRISFRSLTNNLSFTVLTFCFDDGVGAWLVSSPYCELSEDEIYAIKMHLSTLGFNLDNFVKLDFSNCAQCGN